jgi:cytochrome bd ubiquinol oxidase subunit I
MRTADAVSPMPGLVVPFVGFTLLYCGLAVAVVWLLYRQIIKTGVDGTMRPGITQELPLPRVTPATSFPTA